MKPWPTLISSYYMRNPNLSRPSRMPLASLPCEMYSRPPPSLAISPLAHCMSASCALPTSTQGALPRGNTFERMRSPSGATYICNQ